MSLKSIKEIGRGSFWSFVSTALVKLLALFYLLFQARFFDPAEIGLFQLVFSIVSLVTLFIDVGFYEAIVRYVAYYLGKGKPELAKGLYKYSLILFAILSVGVAVVFYLLVPFISEYYNNPLLKPLLYLAVIYVLFTFFSKSFAFIVALKKIKLNTKLTVIQQFLKVFLTVVFAFWIGPTAEALLLAFLLGLGFSWILGFLFSLKFYKDIPAKPKCSLSRFKSEILPFSVISALVLIMFVLLGNMDKIMLGGLLVNHFLQNEIASMIGHYSVSYSFAGFLLFFTFVISTIFLPVLSGLYGKGNLQEIRKTSHRVIYWLILLSTPIFVVFLAFPSQILMILSPTYSQDSTIFRILSLGYFVYLFGWVQSTQFIALRKNKINAIIMVFVVLLDFVLNLILIPLYNIVGAAISTAISFSFGGLCFAYFGYKKLNFELPRKLLKPLLAGAFVVLVLFFFKPFIGEILRTAIPHIINAGSTETLILEKIIKTLFLGIIAGISFVLYLFVLVLLRGFSKEDVDLLVAGMKKGKVPDKIVGLVKGFLLWRS